MSHTVSRISRRYARRLQLSRLEERTAPTVVPVGAEFFVNTYTTSIQRSASVAIDYDADFVITWASYQGASYTEIYAQRYASNGGQLGSEFRVNSYTTGHQDYPSVAMDQDGDFVVAWSGQGPEGTNGIYAQRYDGFGQEQGSQFRVNTSTTGGLDPSVAMDQNGNFVVTWEGSSDGSNSGIFAQRFNSSGLPVGDVFLVNTVTAGAQRTPSVAIDQNGDFVIAWMSYLPDFSDVEIAARLFNSAGVPQGGEFQVNTYTTSLQRVPTVAMDSIGDFVVAWHGKGVDDGLYNIYAQRYSSAGVALGTQFRVNATTIYSHKLPTAAMNQNGDFIIAWQSYENSALPNGVFGQAFTANGMFHGSEFPINTTATGAQYLPSVQMNPSGDFLVAWTGSPNGFPNDDIYGQRYKFTLPPIVDQFLIGDGFAQRSRIANLTVTFNAPVSLPTNPASAFTLKRQSDNATISLNGSIAGNTVTLTFAPGTAVEFGSLADGLYTLTALASQINGGNFDGNGDGIPGDNYTFDFHRLFGDGNGDHSVNSDDFALFRSAFGVAGVTFDFDGNGTVDSGDFAEFRKRFGITLVP